MRPVCDVPMHAYTAHAGIIAGSFVVLNSVIGIIASMRNSQNFFIAHLVLSVLVVLMLVACALMAWFLNLEPIGKCTTSTMGVDMYAGTDRHPSWGSNMCVLHRYDHNRLVAMNYQHTVTCAPIFCPNTRVLQYEFARCIRDMKYGVAAHAINLVMAVVTCKCVGRARATHQHRFPHVHIGHPLLLPHMHLWRS
jgi:hypothetical protein